jgi:uncharacterized protein (DUF1800 family)
MRTTTSPNHPASTAENQPDAEPHEPSRDEPEAGSKDERSSRRSFFFFGAMAAASLLPGAAQAQVRSRRRPAEKPKPTDVVEEPADAFPTLRPNERPAAFTEWGSDAAPVSRLVRRVTMGATAGDMSKAAQMGWQGYLNYQLNYTRIDDSACETVVQSRYPLMFQTSDQLGQLTDQGTVYNQLRESTIYRAAFSQRQLYQRMVEFWTDHFNQDLDKVGYLYVSDLRDVIRKNALGRFPDMVKASAHSASMMAYLDQNASRNTAPNQNYARELLELHTVGVDNGYTQTDVAELSRVLTGWTIQGRGNFVFNPAIHDRTAKTVMGVQIPAAAATQGAAGIQEGETIIEMLVNHPNTAQFISRKMLAWLLDPEPTQAQVDTVAAVYRATGGDIKSMIRVILNESWLAAAPMKLKRPYHYLVSALRAANPNVVSISPMIGQLNNLGHQLFAWDTPDGYPDKIEYWAGNIVPRWSFASTFANLNSTTTIQLDTTAYRAGSPAAAIDMIDQNFFGGEMPSVTRSALLAYAGTTALTDARTRELISLSLSANAFQWY